jgi:hypothetical protein
MTEAQWRGLTDPVQLITACVRLSPKDAATARKTYLAACAVCWRYAHLSSHPLSVGCIQAAEKDADKVDVRGEMYQLSKEIRGERVTRVERSCAGLIQYKASPEQKLMTALVGLVESQANRPPEQPPMNEVACDLIRSVFGCLYSPYIVEAGVPCQATRPVNLAYPSVSRAEVGLLLEPVPWVTPEVLSLAEQAYAERVVRECPVCGGTGERSAEEQTGENVRIWLRFYDTQKKGERLCRRCHGTAITHDGQMLRDNLLVLRDALVDAGCPEEIVECEEKQAGMYCPACGFRGSWTHPYGENTLRKCHRRGCGQTWVPGEVIQKKNTRPNPLLAELGEEKPRYRGFWPVDFIQGL